jgi:hypothetical protein
MEFVHDTPHPQIFDSFCTSWTSTLEEVTFLFQILQDKHRLHLRAYDERRRKLHQHRVGSNTPIRATDFGLA